MTSLNNMSKMMVIGAATLFSDEPLSKKETQVLCWLDTELSGPQIASKLFISLNTFRSHTKKIYSKLGVSSRRAAVNKAHSLNLLP